MSDYEDAYFREVYPRYIELICAIVRMAYHDSTSSYLVGEWRENIETYYRIDARRFVRWLDGSSRKCPTSTVDTKIRRRILDIAPRGAASRDTRQCRHRSIKAAVRRRHLGRRYRQTQGVRITIRTDTKQSDEGST